MGELVPIIVLIFIALVVVACLFWRKQLSIRQVVKPLSEADMIERNTYVLKADDAQKLVNGVKYIIDEGKPGKFELLMGNKVLAIEVTWVK